MQKYHTEDSYLRMEAYLAFNQPGSYLTLIKRHPCIGDYDLHKYFYTTSLQLK